MGNLMTRITDCQRRMKTMFEVFEGETPRVLLLGLDGAGKTTLLYNAKLEDYIYAIGPPKGCMIEHITPRRGATLQVYDFPGSKLTRHLWHNWFKGAEAIVFVVDSADKIRIDEAKFELHDLLTSRWLRKVPLIVAANKQDLPDHMHEDKITKELDLDSITNRDWAIIGVSAEKKPKGIAKIFEDAVEMIVAYRHYKSSLTTKQTEIKHTAIKDNNNVAKEKGGPVFTSIEDADAMKEDNIPSLFQNIKATEIDKSENGDELVDSGHSSRESVTYDQMNDEQDGVVKPDSVKDDDESVKSVQDKSSDSGHEEQEDAVKETSRQASSVDSNETDSVSHVSDVHEDGGKDIAIESVESSDAKKERDHDIDDNDKSTVNVTDASVTDSDSDTSENDEQGDTSNVEATEALDNSEDTENNEHAKEDEDSVEATPKRDHKEANDDCDDGHDTMVKSLNNSDISNESVNSEEKQDKISTEGNVHKNNSSTRDENKEMITDLDDVSDDEEVDLV